MDFVELLFCAIVAVVFIVAAAAMIVPGVISRLRHRKTFAALTELTEIVKSSQLIAERFLCGKDSRDEFSCGVAKSVGELNDWKLQYDKYLDSGRCCYCEKCENLFHSATEGVKRARELHAQLKKAANGKE